MWKRSCCNICFLCVLPWSVNISKFHCLNGKRHSVWYWRKNVVGLCWFCITKTDGALDIVKMFLLLWKIRNATLASTIILRDLPFPCQPSATPLIYILIWKLWTLADKMKQLVRRLENRDRAVFRYYAIRHTLHASRPQPRNVNNSAINPYFSFFLSLFFVLTFTHVIYSRNSPIISFCFLVIPYHFIYIKKRECVTLDTFEH